jgi:hypothetical protein
VVGDYITTSGQDISKNLEMIRGTQENFIDINMTK